MTVDSIDKLITIKILKASGFIQSQTNSIVVKLHGHSSSKSLCLCSKRELLRDEKGVRCDLEIL